MALDSKPDFRVNVYGDQPGGVEDISRSMALGGPSGGGGFPWFGGPKASPTFPNPNTMLPPLDANPWPATPYQPGVTPSQPGAAGGGAAGAGGLASLFAGMSPREIAGLIMALGGTVGGALSGGGENFSPTTTTSDPQLQALMRSMQGRLDKSEPLYDSVLNMANGLLPTQYQKGGGGMG